MLRHPVIVTSLEEDFRKLGLLRESEDEFSDEGGGGMAKDSPVMKSKSGGKKQDPAAHPDDGEEKGEDPTDDPDGIPHGGKPQPKQSLPKLAKEETGMPGNGKNSGKGKSKMSPSTPSQETVAEEEDEEDDKDDEEEDKDKSDHDEDSKDEEYDLIGADGVLEAVRRARGMKSKLLPGKHTMPGHGGWTSMKGHKDARTESRSSKPFDKVSSLMEEVTRIMESIDDQRRGESVKAFANIAIISEMLSRGFKNFGEGMRDKDLLGTSDAFSVLATEAADIAKALESDTDIDAEALQTEFKDEMGALFAGLDLYSDVVESVGLDEADKEDDDEEDDDDGDDEEPDDDEDDEPKKKEEAQAGYMPYGKTKPVAKPGMKPAMKPAMESRTPPFSSKPWRTGTRG